MGSDAIVRAGLVMVLVLLAGCGTPVRTFVEADDSADFSRYRTYAWGGDEGVAAHGRDAASPAFTAVTLQSLRAAIERSLAERGLIRGQPADMVIDYRAGTRDRVRTTFSGRDAFYFGDRYGRHPVWPLFEQRRIETYQESVLAIDMFDARTGRAVWSGLGATTVALNAAEPQVIEDVVAEILANFPPSEVR